MAKTVADQFGERLAGAGVKQFYGIVGDSLKGFTFAIRGQGKDSVASREAREGRCRGGAEAHLMSELAVSAESRGPGNRHLTIGLHESHRSRVPVLAIAIPIPSAEIGGNWRRES